MIALIDNYDSFTYNVVQRLGEIDSALNIQVYRNDHITVDELKAKQPERIIISPGPGNPTEAGVSNDVIKAFYQDIPVLGICLGHQCIGHCFGADIVQAANIMHGKTSEMEHDNQGVFANLPQPFTATRYHSLVIKEDTLHEDFIITARSQDDLKEIMGVRHKQYPLHGVQFHPESFLTEDGFDLLRNFLAL